MALCDCCGARIGASSLAPGGGTRIRFKPGTEEAKADPGTFQYCSVCREYEFDPDVMEVVGAFPAPVQALA